MAAAVGSDVPKRIISQYVMYVSIYDGRQQGGILRPLAVRVFDLAPRNQSQCDCISQKSRMDCRSQSSVFSDLMGFAALFWILEALAGQTSGRPRWSFELLSSSSGQSVIQYDTLQYHDNELWRRGADG